MQNFSLQAKIPALLFVFATCQLLEADEPPAFTVKPIRLTCTALLPAAMTSSMRNVVSGQPFSFVEEAAAKTRYEAVFLIAGAGLIAIDAGSLNIDRATTPDGGNISRDYRGLSTWTAGKESPVSEDGKSGVFSVAITTDDPAPRVPVTVKGSIRVKTSDKALAATHTVQLQAVDEEPVALGPFQVSVSTQRQTLRVKLTGPSEMLAALEVASGGKKLSSNTTQFTSGGITGNVTMSIKSTATDKDGEVNKTTFNESGDMGDVLKKFVFPESKTSDESRTYSYTLPKDAAEAVVTLNYWGEPKDQVLPFETTVF